MAQDYDVALKPALNSLRDHKVLGREFKKGLQQGEAKLLRRQLAYRFEKLPKWVSGKRSTATSAQSKSGQYALWI